MFKIFIASLFVIVLASGCSTEEAGRPHQGCHRVGPRLPGHSSTIHHHYAKPDAPVEEKSK